MRSILRAGGFMNIAHDIVSHATCLQFVYIILMLAQVWTSAHHLAQGLSKHSYLCVYMVCGGAAVSNCSSDP